MTLGMTIYCCQKKKINLNLDIFFDLTVVKNIYCVVKAESRENEILIRVGGRRRVNVIMTFIFSQIV